jgi:predicted glycosyltransferase
MMFDTTTTPLLTDPSPTQVDLRKHLRIALYSHDTQGLGHIRRNLLLASVFQRMGCEPVILLLSGAREMGAFAIPPRVDCVTLPALRKNEGGQYGSRSLSVPVSEVVDIRSRVFRAALESFQPDVFIVDKAPRGALNELDGVLASLRESGRTRLVLGLREILDDASSVAREWVEGGFERTIRDCYDRVWVYGDPRVFDPAVEYNLTESVREKLRYTGYLDPRDCWSPQRGATTGSPDTDEVPPPPFVLCEVGGGQDGAPLARAFLSSRLPHGHTGVLVTGPQMPDAQRAEFQTAAEARRDIKVFEFITDCRPVLERASRVIAMGGYNTVCEVLAHGKQSLIVPRVRPRTEQLIRAQRLSRMGLLDMLHPRDLSAGSLSEWMSSPSVLPANSGPNAIDLRGTQRLPGLIVEAMSGRLEVVHAAC